MVAASRRRLEQRTHIHVEAQVGKRSGNHLGAAIVAVLAHLGHQDARPPAFEFGELLRHRQRLLELRIALALGRVHA